MGHRIVDLSISHNEMDGKDEICVTIYRAKYASGEDREEVAYHYSVFNKAQERFVPNRQRFSKYGVEYNFNLLDVVICGTQDKEAAEKLRYRRVLFAIVPQEGEEVEVEEVRREESDEKRNFLTTSILNPDPFATRFAHRSARRSTRGSSRSSWITWATGRESRWTSSLRTGALTGLGVPRGVEGAPSISASFSTLQEGGVARREERASLELGGADMSGPSWNTTRTSARGGASG